MAISGQSQWGHSRRIASITDAAIAACRKIFTSPEFSIQQSAFESSGKFFLGIDRTDLSLRSDIQHRQVRQVLGIPGRKRRSNARTGATPVPFAQPDRLTWPGLTALLDWMGKALRSYQNKPVAGPPDHPGGWPQK